MGDDFLTGPKEIPASITVTEIRERFAAAGLPCRVEIKSGEARLVFEGRETALTFVVTPLGEPLTATMPDDLGQDTGFACAVFDVFDGIGWIYDVP